MHGRHRLAPLCSNPIFLRPFPVGFFDADFSRYLELSEPTKEVISVRELSESTRLAYPSRPRLLSFSSSNLLRDFQLILSLSLFLHFKRFFFLSFHFPKSVYLNCEPSYLSLHPMVSAHANQNSIGAEAVLPQPVTYKPNLTSR